MNNNSHIHISFDLETLSTESNAAIIQIGATVVGSTESFERCIEPKSAERLGGHVDVDTIEWWNKQNAELRKYVFSGTCPITEALDEFHGWCDRLADGDMNRIYLWSKGADFDCVVLKNNYEFYRTYPFNFRNHSCVRTAMRKVDIASINTAWNAHNPTAVMHNALTDARYQAHIIQAFLAL